MIPLEDFKRIEQKLDIILDAFGLGDKRPLAPCEIKQMSENILLKYRKKRANDKHHEHPKG